MKRSQSNARLMTRRDALRMGFLGLAAGGLTGFSPRTVFGGTRATMTGDPKLLIIFGRGGNDGLNTVIPYGDTLYPTIRPINQGGSDISIGVPPPAGSSPLWLNSHCALHPRLAPLLPLWPNRIAFAHRVHYPNPNFSHFISQQIWETGFAPAVGGSLVDEGIVPRLVNNLALSGNFNASSVSARIQQLFRTTNPAFAKRMSHITSVPDYALDGKSAGSTQKFRSALQSLATAPASTAALDPLVRASTESLTSGEPIVSSLPTYVPKPATVFPTGPVGPALQGALNLLRNTDCRIAGVEFGNFDTHAAQGAITGQHGDRLEDLALALKAVYDETTDAQDLPTLNLITVFISEFGRTSAQNGASGGTDHGQASVTIMMGHPVQPNGIFNCDATNWPSGTMENAPGYPGGPSVHLGMATDFRAILAEIWMDHFGLSSAQVADILPGWSTLQTPGQAPSNFLNFM